MYEVGREIDLMDFFPVFHTRTMIRVKRKIHCVSNTTTTMQKKKKKIVEIIRRIDSIFSSEREI